MHTCSLFGTCIFFCVECVSLRLLLFKSREKRAKLEHLERMALLWVLNNYVWHKPLILWLLYFQAETTVADKNFWSFDWFIFIFLLHWRAAAWNVSYIMYTSNPTGEKHTISTFVDQTHSSAYSPMQKGQLISKLVFQWFIFRLQQLHVAEQSFVTFAN